MLDVLRTRRNEPSDMPSSLKRSSDRSDHVSLHLAVYRALTKTGRQRSCSRIGHLIETTRSLRLDLASKRCALAVAHGWIAM